MVTIRRDEKEITNFKKFLTLQFEIKNLGNPKYFLGMEVARSSKAIVVSQKKYVLEPSKKRV